MIILDWREKGKKARLFFFFQNLGFLTKCSSKVWIFQG